MLLQCVMIGSSRLSKCRTLRLISFEQPTLTDTDIKRVARPGIVGVMGAGENARAIDIRNAFALGSAIAEESWTVLTGGRSRGVMDAVSKGAKACGLSNYGCGRCHVTQTITDHKYACT